MYTKNCIVCGKPARRWSGHIHTEIGQIISGWCDEHYNGNRPRSRRCTSINPSSCGGEYRLAEIELREELNEETLLRHRKSEEFSEMIDRNCSPYYPVKKESLRRTSYYNLWLKILLCSQIVTLIIIILVFILRMSMKTTERTCENQTQGYERWDKKQIP